MKLFNTHLFSCAVNIHVHRMLLTVVVAIVFWNVCISCTNGQEQTTTE